MKKINSLFSLPAIVLLGLCVLFMSETGSAQQVNKIFDQIGGGGSNSQSNSESGSSNTMYIVGGVLILGVILYSVLKEKKEPEKKDTTSVVINADQFVMNGLHNDSELEKSNNLPVSIFAGTNSEMVFREEKRYFVGISFNF